MCQIPESYRAYCLDLVVQTAVDHILGRSNQLVVPPDIEWEDLPEFHKAVLSAHRVRCEYANYLIDLWNCIWQPALDNCGFEVMPRTITDTQRWQEYYNLHTYEIWKKGWFLRAFAINGTGFTLALGTFADIKQARISLCFWDDQEDENIELNLGDGWNPNEANWPWPPHVVSIRGLATIGDHEIIDLDPLHNVAGFALAAVNESINP